MTAEVRLRLAGQVEHLRFAWQAGEALLEDIPFTDDPEGTRYNILLATQEILTNVLRHGYGLDASRPIELAFSSDGDQVEIEVRDCGPEFDPLAHDTSYLETAADCGIPETEGGFGIHIAKIVMDDLAYRRDDGWNVFTMVKGLAAREGISGGERDEGRM